MRRRFTRRRALTGIGTLAVGVSVAGCTGGSGEGGGDYGGGKVEMTDDLAFDPADIKIATGEAVTWENASSAKHTVTAYEDELPDGAAYFASGGFDSEQAAREAYPEGAIAADESYEHTFETEGTYEYFCIPHGSGGMNDTIEVSQEGPQL